MSSRLEELLVTLGFTKYEAKAYISLLIKGVATVSEIADLSGVPYTRAYDTLVSLENKGFVASLPGKPMKFKAINPEIALKSLLERKTREIHEQLEKLERNVSIALRELKNLYTYEPEEPVVIVRGKISSLNLIREAINENIGEKGLVVCSNFDKILGKQFTEEIKSKGVQCIEIKNNEEICVIILSKKLFIFVPEEIDEYSFEIIFNSQRIASFFHKLVSFLKNNSIDHSVNSTSHE
jgi:sugar-specific transcriptional regulator TrmB